MIRHPGNVLPNRFYLFGLGLRVGTGELRHALRGASDGVPYPGVFDTRATFRDPSGVRIETAKVQTSEARVDTGVGPASGIDWPRHRLPSSP